MLIYNLQKQLSEVSITKVVLRNFAKFTGKLMCEKDTVARCFTVNFAKFLEHLWWLLLNLTSEMVK